MKRYQFFILTLAFVATLLSSFHVHDNGHVNEDCQVCILQHNIASADIIDFTALTKRDVYFDAPVYTSTLTFLKTYTSFNSRAPPSFF
ncbi:hypothetical protein JHD50_02505 [Sulfurimonas sp. MAG313]|nr:hypothetical protein [Sulfurimonas sp. MAG313]MDF1880183.1 hypothetical protein [Sulfurimonas sp. MAG313]